MNESNRSMAQMDVSFPRPSTSSMASNEEIYLFKLLESHSLELDSLNTECKTKLPKLLSQRLPRFMRRRASSHNPKRVPKSVRQSVVNKTKETKKGSKDQKKKNRKKYVNPKKQELSLKRRSAKNDRSVLHVWFAKRFKMGVHWNHLIPEKNSTKNERILYHNSKNDFVFYYLSFYSCIQIDYSPTDRQQLIDYLNKFSHSDIGCTFGAKIYESGSREGSTVLYGLGSYPFEPIVGSTFLWNQTVKKVWLWVHISVYDKVLQLLNDSSQTDYSNKFKFIGRKAQLERFRIIGPNGHKLLEKCLKYNFNEDLNSHELSADSVHYYKCNENIITSVDRNESNLFEDFCGTNPKPKTSKDFDFALIIKNNSFKNRFTTDLIVLSESAKTLWVKLTENRGHRTGGVHDLQMIALNTSSLLFPKFGFIDVKENESKVEKLKTLLTTESDKQFFVIRSQAMISKLTKDMNSLTVRSVLESIEHKSNALINVELNCLNRGVPQELDPICIPSEEEIEREINRRDDSNSTRMEENSNDMNRKIIGLIEFGKYSLETSRGKGLGVITIEGLEELIKISEKINLKNRKIYKNNNIFGSFKSLKSSMHRIVSIRAIGSVFSA